VIDAVEVRDLRLVHGAHVALDDTTFSCRSGTSVAIVGPNGSGKSTLLNALGGLHAPAAGSVRVLGRYDSPRPAPKVEAVEVCISFRQLKTHLIKTSTPEVGPGVLVFDYGM
jgi:ABC-type multidrug transport system ATPase subunit